jgi:glycerol-3-phosphate acyltransferase PlsY
VHIALRKQAGWLLAAVAVIVDIAKGVFPVLLGFGFSLSVWAVSLAAVAAVLGQMWPPLRGHGEKGNSTGVGALLALMLVNEAYLALLSIVFFAFGAALRFMMLRSSSPVRQDPEYPLSRTLPLGMLLGFITAPLLSWVGGQPIGVTAGLLLILTAVVAKRLTADLRVDLSVGAPTCSLLMRRLLFDQSLAGRD